MALPVVPSGKRVFRWGRARALRSSQNRMNTSRSRILRVISLSRRASPSGSFRPGPATGDAQKATQKAERGSGRIQGVIYAPKPHTRAPRGHKSDPGLYFAREVKTPKPKPGNRPHPLGVPSRRNLSKPLALPGQSLPLQIPALGLCGWNYGNTCSHGNPCGNEGSCEGQGRETRRGKVALRASGDCSLNAGIGYLKRGGKTTRRPRGILSRQVNPPLKLTFNSTTCPE